MHLLSLGGCGPPLLLLHANGFHNAVFKPMVDSCFGSFRCLGVDLPGHGDAHERGTRCAAIAPTVDLLTDTITQAGLRGRCLVFGHSLGGALALAAEAATPGLFAAIYAYEPVAGPADDTAGRSMAATRVLSAMARRRRAEFGSMQEAAERLGSKPPFAGFHPAAFAAFLSHGLAPQHSATTTTTNSSSSSNNNGVGAVGLQTTWVLKCEPEVEASWYEAVGSWVDIDTPRVGCPVIIAVGGTGGKGSSNGGSSGSSGTGSKDGGSIHATLPALGTRLAARLPHGTLRQFDSLQHFGPLEAPEEVGQDAKAFFLGVLADSSSGKTGGGGGDTELAAPVMSRL